MATARVGYALEPKKVESFIQPSLLHYAKQHVAVKEPKSFDFGSIEQLGLRFPVIAKPLEANSTVDSHNLFLVFDFDGVKSLNNPMVLQEFVNHGGVVFKIYVAGQHSICSLIVELARALRERLGLNLFNVDVIRDGNNPRRYLVIDINYFPGFAKLPSFESFFTNFLLDVVQQTKTD
ncbi:inositol-tetrakisphosphate 1-kinase 1-like [Trifolium medium]|uniref:Inositol-tetrakisphosphate 1-kinase 1-like n=1 Tax=Trifolium medium TaxID=97028 RepID=A0A392NJM7_9FABA|nr:inositol-tetrakisphosphate 1-kinase 1-like [Trifolium medium]